MVILRIYIKYFSNVYEMVGESALRLVSFVNTHLAIIAFLGPWLRVEDPYNLHMDIWTLKNQAKDAHYEDMAKTRTVIAFLGVSFGLSVLAHLVVEFMSSFQDSFVVKWSLNSLVLGQIISSLVAFVVWDNIHEDFEILDDVNAMYVGFIFSIIHMVLNVFIGAFLVTKEYMYQRV